MTLIATYYIFI